MLYLVATPIGNLADISLRALETLRGADVVASEDTRHTGRLLSHYEINARQISYHEHNKRRAAERIAELLRQGKDVALVTDAGTPGISDPAFTVVREALDQGSQVSMIPGATAFVMALVLSGLPVHSFTFRGFTPRKQTARRKFYTLDVDSPYTLIYYESRYRLIASLEDALAVFGDRRAAVANDLTKMYERVWRGTLSELIETLREAKILGEFVIVIEGQT